MHTVLCTPHTRKYILPFLRSQKIISKYENVDSIFIADSFNTYMKCVFIRYPINYLNKPEPPITILLGSYKYPRKKNSFD